MSIEIAPLAEGLGAEISGVPLDRSLSDAEFAEIHRAFLNHVVVVFSDLDLTVDQLAGFGRRFGPLVPHIHDQYHHPETSDISIVSNAAVGGEIRPSAAGAGAFWHSDLSYMQVPADVTFLYSVEIPPTGGDTLFANMYRAYETLPGDLKQRIEGKRAVHRIYGNPSASKSRIQLTADQRRKTPDPIHPMVRTHRETGRKALYANPGTTVRIVDMDNTESDETLAAVFEHSLRPEFQYRHKWRVGQLVCMDNRSAMHCATSDYALPDRRTLWRAIVGGVPEY